MQAGTVSGEKNSALKNSVDDKELGVSFLNVARESGLQVKTFFGGEHKNKYLLETTGCGVAFYDYDNDGWLDIFLVNGWRLEGFSAGSEPISHLFAIIVMAPLPMLPPRLDSGTPAGGKEFASETMTMMAGMIFL